MTEPILDPSRAKKIFDRFLASTLLSKLGYVQTKNGRIIKMSWNLKRTVVNIG